MLASAARYREIKKYCVVENSFKKLPSLKTIHTHLVLELWNKIKSPNSNSKNLYPHYFHNMNGNSMIQRFFNQEHFFNLCDLRHSIEIMGETRIFRCEFGWWSSFQTSRTGPIFYLKIFGKLDMALDFLHHLFCQNLNFSSFPDTKVDHFSSWIHSWRLFFLRPISIFVRAIRVFLSKKVKIEQVETAGLIIWIHW